MISKGEGSRLQYQALRKATGTVQGTSAEKVNQIAGVESVDIHMDNNQVRFVARCVEDPTKLGDMLPVGFGDAGGVLSMTNFNTAGKKDLTRAVSILPEGKPLWGGTCPRIDIEEVDVRPRG